MTIGAVLIVLILWWLGKAFSAALGGYIAELDGHGDDPFERERRTAQVYAVVWLLTKLAICSVILFLFAFAWSLGLIQMMSWVVAEVVTGFAKAIWMLIHLMWRSMTGECEFSKCM